MSIQAVNSQATLLDHLIFETHDLKQSKLCFDQYFNNSHEGVCFAQTSQFLEFSKISPSKQLSPALNILQYEKLEDYKNPGYSNKPLEAIRKVYNDEGRIIQCISSDGTLNYKIDYLGNSTIITNEITGEIHIQEFNDHGHMIKETLPCGLEISFKYEGDLLTEICLPNNSKVIYQLINQKQYKITKMNPQDEVEYEHTYDCSKENEITETLIGNMGQFTTQYDPFSYKMTYKTNSLQIVDQFDENMALLSKTFVDPVDESQNVTLQSNPEALLASKFRQLDDRGRVIQYGEYSCDYDSEGRMIQKKSNDQVINYEYDALDRMTCVRIGDKKVEYTYDIEGRRLSKTITENGESKKEFYLYHGANQIGVYDENKEPIFFRVLGSYGHPNLPYAIAIESRGQTYAPIYSSTFNLLQLINRDTQEVIDYTSLNPFGDNLQDMNPTSPWIFATKYYDTDTGLVDFGDRQYDPSIKQWTSTDPDPRTNDNEVYSYCNNNPLKFIDPNGNFTWVIPLTQGLWAATAAILTGAGAWAAKKGVDHINEERDRRRTEKKPPFNGIELGTDPRKCPGPGFEWKGNGPPESGNGSWTDGTHKLHPDLEHPDPKGPHWDYIGPNFPNGARIFPDGRWENK